MATTATPAATTAATPTAALTTTKVFVGNLSFNTRQKELQQAFQAAANVISANIITRGPRSLGYGFVEFASEADAKKAVNLMNKKEVDGRVINVEIAKAREDGIIERPQRNEGEGFDRRRGRGNRGGGFIRRNNRDGGAPNNNNNNNTNNNNNSNNNQNNREGGFIPRPRGAFRGAPRNAGPRGSRNFNNVPPGEKQEPRQGTPSSTTLFVANLPFKIDDAGLKDLFKAYGVADAHVVIKRNGRSKGFGFVEFKGPEDQQKALHAMDKQLVDGRDLIVKVALTEPQAASGEKPAEKTVEPPKPAAATTPAQVKTPEVKPAVVAPATDPKPAPVSPAGVEKKQ